MPYDACAVDLIPRQAGKTLFNGQSKRDRRGAKGTTIVVRELFHNVGSVLTHALNKNDTYTAQVPVRQLALAATSTQSTLSACKKVIETLALARPSVSWIFWEEKAVGTSVGGSKRILSIPPVRVATTSTNEVGRSSCQFRDGRASISIGRYMGLRVSR